MIQVLIQEKDKDVFVLQNTETIASYISKKDTTVWVDVQKPAETDMGFLEKYFSFHPLAIEDCMTTIQRPKIDRYENYLFIVLHAAIIAPHKDKASSLELDSFVGENYVVTVHFKPVPSVGGTWERCIKNTHIMSQGAAYLFYFLADALVDNYFPILEKLDKEIQKAEDSIFKNADATALNKLFILKENVLLLRRTIGPQRETMNFIARGDYQPMLPDKLSIYFRDVSDLLARINDTLDTYRDLLTASMDGYLSVTSNKLNEIMKVLTIIATIMMPLTLVTGIYGMNFRFMPEITWRYGYFFVLLLMVAIAGGMLFFFKKKKWL
ncbi:MAG: magnesium/cobalt transporter CorA [Candidatus Omnitrophica bacterium]|nr:magnesium/cobalt transporter CorA [Candidatus Omnitrophota bacterium]